MNSTDEPQEDFTKTRDHEYQDAHYHDEEPEIVNDEQVKRGAKAGDKKKSRIPPPRRRHYED